MPVVAIVGRPNVGKSSLLNALTRRKVSIVQDMPGVTRDRVAVPFQVEGKWVDLVDTGGFGFDDKQGLTEHIKHQIELAMARANLVLFVVDAHDGLVEGDKIIAKLLREQGAKVVMLANKTDSPKYEQAIADFSRLGLGTPLGVSATTSKNLDRVAGQIAANMDLSAAPTELPEPDLHIAIVGKRNAGKSTVVNAISLLHQGDPDRVIVSEVPGTTRDSVDVRFEKDGKTLVVIDTAGVRKKRHMVNDDIEFYSFHRAQRSIRRADVVVMLVDAIEPISEPDKKLAQYLLEQAKPVVIAFNKWDLALAKAKEQSKGKAVESELMDDFERYAMDEFRGLSFAPVAYLTGKDGRKVQALLDDCRKLAKQSLTRLSTSQLNNAVKTVIEERVPSAPGRARPKVYYATQTAIQPPTIVLFVNKVEWFNENYLRFVTNRFRELLPFGQVPIRLLLRQSKGDEKTEATIRAKSTKTRPSVKAMRSAKARRGRGS